MIEQLREKLMVMPPDHYAIIFQIQEKLKTKKKSQLNFLLQKQEHDYTFYTLENSKFFQESRK